MAEDAGIYKDCKTGFLVNYEKLIENTDLEILLRVFHGNNESSCISFYNLGKIQIINPLNQIEQGDIQGELPNFIRYAVVKR